MTWFLHLRCGSVADGQSSAGIRPFGFRRGYYEPVFLNILNDSKKNEKICIFWKTLLQKTSSPLRDYASVFQKGIVISGTQGIFFSTKFWGPIWKGIFSQIFYLETSVGYSKFCKFHSNWNSISTPWEQIIEISILSRHSLWLQTI